MGIEPHQDSTGKTAFCQRCGTESGTVESAVSLRDSNVSMIADAWPDLPEAIRVAIIAMISAAKELN